jgi:predicted phosphodiesterase
MKICLFSDIHGNKHAFEAALPLILEKKADYNIFLGDICGYYFETIAVWRTLREMPDLIALIGNHDAFFLQFATQGFVPDAYTERYGPALKMLLAHDPVELSVFLDWLEGLSHFHHDPCGRFSCFHGGPNQAALEYIYPDTPLPEAAVPFVFMGHTHCPMAKAGDRSVFCNPGALGQPRHGSKASFAVVEIDEDAWQWNLHPINFDQEALISSLASFEPLPQYLTDILRK